MPETQGTEALYYAYYHHRHHHQHSHRVNAIHVYSEFSPLLTKIGGKKGVELEHLPLLRHPFWHVHSVLVKSVWERTRMFVKLTHMQGNRPRLKAQVYTKA